MTSLVFRAETRGYSNIGWLRSYHTFSFADYMNEERVHFGALRVFNDDVVRGGAGFGTHPHHNMEIISIPLAGTLVHRDSMGNEHALVPGDVQVMSAGTGLTHSEFNGSADADLAFLQIWIIPAVRNVTPRYDDVRRSPEEGRGSFHTVVGPHGANLPLFIHQDAYLSIADLDEGASTTYTLRDATHGTFTFVISGAVTVEGTDLAQRDAVGITGADAITVTAAQASTVVTIEVPML